MAAFFEWLKCTAALFSKHKDRTECLEQETFPRVYNSQLEDRRVLNAGAVATAIDLVSLRFDAGQAANNGVADKFELSRLDSSTSTNQVAVTINNQRVWEGSATEIQSIRFEGSSDADQFYIDPTIQVAAGVFIDGNAIATRSQLQVHSDVIVFAAPWEMHFDEITYQTSDNLAQVRFVSTAQQLNSVVQVQNVESISDLNSASNRSFIASSTSGNYALRDSNVAGTDSNGQTVQWTSDQSQVEFNAPTNRLTIDMRSSTAGSDSLSIDSFQHSGLKQLEVLGDDSDSVRLNGVHLNGAVSVGQSISIRAGMIDVTGSLSTTSAGEIRLDAGSGVLNINGEINSRGDDIHRGGSVTLTGERVLLNNSTRVDVSGGTGGGQIRVGGGYQGKDTTLHNSRYTSVSANTTLNADARIRGNGGKIIVWSDDTSIIEGSGNLFARGGLESGDGGFIETSGKRYLRIDGAANTSATNGQGGTWLIDPDDIEIVTVAGAAPNTSYVLISTIVTGLAGGNVTIITNNPSPGSGDIRIVDPLNLAPGSARILTLNATRDIIFQSGLTGNSNLQVNLIAGRDVDSTASTIGQLASLTIDAGRNISLGATDLSGGTLTATIDSNNDDASALFESTGALSAAAISISGSTTVNDNVTLGSTVTATTGAILLSRVVDLTFRGDVAAATNITFSDVSGPLALTTNVDVTANNGPLDFSTITGGMQLIGSNGSTNILTASGATGSLTLGAVATTNPNVGLTLSSSTNTSVGSINLQNGTLTATIDSDNNNVGATFQSTGALTAGAISISGSATSNDNVTLGSTATTTTGAIQFTQINNLTFQADVTAATNVTFSSVSGQFALGSNADVTANNGPLDFSTISGGMQLSGNNGSTNLITTNGATGSLTLGAVTTTNSNVGLTLSSSTNTSVGNIDLQNGTLTATIDSDNNNAGATFQSTGALTAGAISISGSATANDNVTVGSTATTTTGAIQFTQINNLTFQADVNSATNVTFTSVIGQLALGSNADVTANNGPLDFSSITGGMQLTGSNGSTNVLTANGATGSLTLGAVANTNSNVGLTLSSATNASVGSINLQNGTLSATIDSDNNNVGATFQSTGALSAGAISISGSATANDNVTLGSTATTTNGAIQFSQINTLTFQGDVTAATNVTFSSVSGQLALGSNADITANNGPLDLSTITGGIQLNGSNGSTNILTANGATGSLSLGAVTTTNSNVGLTLSSATNTSVGSINLQNGTLNSTIDSDNNNVGATFQSTGALSAGAISISGSATANDNVTLGSTATTTNGAIQFTQINNLTFQGDVTTATNVTFTSVSGQLALGSNADVTANNGPLDFSSITGGMQLTGSNGSTNVLTANGATGNLTLGAVATTNSNVGLTLSSATNTSVGSINLQNGTLSATIDSDNNNVGATFQSTGALSAGAISISGSATANDNVTLGSTATTTTGTIQFTQINNLTFQADVTAATNVTFTSISGQLALGSNADVTANNGPLDFSTITGGVQLTGSNGSTNILTANGTTGSIRLAAISATNANVSLTLNSATDIDAEDINIQSGDLLVTYSGQNVASANVATFKKVTAGSMTVSGNSRSDDQAVLNDTLTISAGGVTINQFGDLRINAPISSTGGVTATGIAGSQTHLAADITTSGGDISMTEGTLVVDGGAARTISSGNGAGSGGNITLGSVDGENGPANLTVDSRGTLTGGSVTIGAVTAATSGLNRLNIRTDAATAGQVTLGSTRLVEKAGTAATLVVASGGNAIRANGVIDLSSNSAVDGGSIDFGTSEVTPTSASSTLTLKTSNTNAAGGNGGDIKFGGVSNNGANYLDSVLIDTSAANSTQTNGDLDFSGKANPRIAVDGTSGTGITLIGTIVKAFSGVLSFLTNPSGAATSSSSIDVSKADFQSTAGLKFDTFGGASTDAGDVVLGDIGVLAANRPNSLVVDTRGSTTSGDLLLDDGAGTSTELHVDGDLNLTNAKIKITDNAVLRTYGTGNVSLGDVSTVAAVARDLTLNSEANISVAAINLSGGTLTANIDSNNNNVGSTFSSSGAISAGTVSLSGSANKDDFVTVGSTLSTTVGAIQFSQFDKVTLNGDVAAQTSTTFSNVAGLTLGTNADVTANNGPIDFSAITSGILLAGINGSTNVLSALGATGSLTIGSVTATNPSVSLSLSSATNTSVGSVNIQNGAFTATVDSDNNQVGASFVSTGALNAGSVSVSGSTTVNDRVTFGSTVTTTTGQIQVTRFEDLRINGDWTTVGGVTTTGVSASQTHLAANITSNSGSISMAGGTLLINGAAVRQIKSGGAAVNAANGGAITLGVIDGEVAAAELEIDSRGTATSGNVVLGNITAAVGNTGLNRLKIMTDSPAPGQVSLSNIRLIAKNVTPASLTVDAGGRTILADGTIDLSSNAVGIAGGRIDFGTSVVAPKVASSTLTVNTSNTNSTSGADGSNGGDVLLGGIGVNSSGATFFDSVAIDLSAADILDSAGTLRFGTVVNPSIQVDGVSGTGIRILGRVDNAAGKVVSLSTNPAGATQNSSAIDVSKASFIGTGGLSFNTSGGNQALSSGSITLGDIGTIVRPVSLVVDTRGTVSSGHLILNDGVAGSATEIRVDGAIDFSNVAVDLLDDVTLESHQDANISLGATNALGGARNLQLTSEGGATVASINLSGGAFQANVDVNNNQAGQIFRSNGSISAGSFTVSGSAANNDIASIGAGITTTGAVSFSNLDQLRIQALIDAGTTFSVSNIVGAVDFSGTSGITANGLIDLLTAVNSIRLSGVAGDTTSIDAKGNTSVVTLAAVNATNPGTRLNVRSDYSADLRNVDMQTGTLDVLVGRSTTQTDAVARLRQVTAGGLIVSGTSTTNDTVVLDGLLTIGTNGISIQNLAKLDVNFNVQSTGDIAANNIRNRIQVAEGISIQSNQGIDLQTNVAQIQLVGILGLTNLFRADGDSSTLKLAAVQALQNVVLVISSANNISLGNIDTAISNLSIKVDNNDNTLGSQLDAGQIQAKQVSILGGTDLNDIANLAGLVESKAGSLLLSSFGTVNANGNVLSSSTIDVSSVSGRVNIGAGRLVKASNGNVTLNNNVNEIRFAGGAGTSSSIQSVNGSVLMSAITEVNTSDFIEVRADRDIQLSSSNLNSRLQLIAGDHNSAAGSINASATLLAGSISMESATGIGTSGAIATATNAISATNRLGGVVQIANSKTGVVTVSNLQANQGGNILFTQSGGGEVRFQQVSSNPDGTPAANESDIRLVNVGGGLVVEGTGVSAGGLGNVVLQTQSAGDIQLLSATRTSGGTVSIQSAQRILGGGLVSSNQVDLNAASGIGTTGAIQTQTTQLRVNSQTNSVDVQNSSAVRATVSQLRSGGFGTVQFTQVGGGDVAFLDVSTGAAASNAGSNINLRNNNGSVLVQGSVVAGGGGSIRFDAQNNLMIGAGSLVQTNGVTATISGNAGGQFQFTPGAVIRAGSSNANTEAVVTAIPPLVNVQPAINSLGVNVDSEGFATLLIQLGSASPALIDRNFSVVIDWGDNEIDRFPIGSLSPLTTDPQIPRFDGSGVIYQITHQYQGNPNPNDPIADIPVKVTVGIDALNRIQFNDSQGPVADLSKTVNESLVTPAAGLISLRFDLPQAPTIPNRIVFNNFVVEPASNSIAPVVPSAEITISSSGSAAEKSRSYVLRIITPINEQGEFDSSEDIELKAKDIEDLSNGELFDKLGDNRYRIYMIREDGVELLLKDFYLRDHRPFEVEDTPASENTQQDDERILDEHSAATTEKNHGLAVSGTEKFEEVEMELLDIDEISAQEEVEEKPLTSATLASGTIALTMRSWRKAARRFRAG